MAGIFQERLLSGQSALVTGGGSGINLRIAERFAEHGCRVMLVGRKEEKLAHAVDLIRSRGGTAEPFPGDVRNYEAMSAAAERMAELWGEIDHVVCGAAGNFPAAAAEMSANGFKSVMDIDLLGTYNACRAVYGRLRKPGASVLSISAIQAFTPMALQAHVCAAKAGVEMLTRVLALEWGPAGVRVNAIAPGPVDETEGMRRLAPTDEIRRQVTESVPLRRFASKDEIADLALFLASPAAAYITGAVVVCDGGVSLAGRSLLPQ